MGATIGVSSLTALMYRFALVGCHGQLLLQCGMLIATTAYFGIIYGLTIQCIISNNVKYN